MQRPILAGSHACRLKLSSPGAFVPAAATSCSSVKKKALENSRVLDLHELFEGLVAVGAKL